MFSMGERLEVLMRIIVAIVTGIILGVWKILIQLFFLINFIWTLIAGKRIKELAELSEIWNTQWYVFIRYMNFVTNKVKLILTSLVGEGKDADVGNEGSGEITDEEIKEKDGSFVWIGILIGFIIIVIIVGLSYLIKRRRKTH